jgi:hypothetical protein
MRAITILRPDITSDELVAVLSAALVHCRVAQSAGDVRESSQPPPSRVSAHNRTTPTEHDIESGHVP